MTDEDQIYYARRELQERRRAARCHDPVARRLHERLAEFYRRLTLGMPHAFSRF